jgi:spore coat polysaccharide biosynthesis protein SpsF
MPDVSVHRTSISNFRPEDSRWELVLTKGILIHLEPKSLPAVYRLLYDCSSRYVLVAEYYNPQPIAVPYRGHSGKLFKRDFAGEMLEQFSDLSLLDYGFVYRRDPTHPQDDITWFLMEKGGPDKVPDRVPDKVQVE